MKKLVVDASVCLKWVFEEEGSDKARGLLKQYEESELLLIAPKLWEYEVVNGFASAVLRNKISLAKAKKLLNLVLEAKVETVSLTGLWEKCLANAHKYKISAYDSAYVTLAQENKMVFVSADDKLAEKIKNPKIVAGLGDFHI